MVPFAGFTDFEDCTSKMKSKGHDDASSKKICGKLQSETKGASELDVLFSAVDYKDCVSKAKDFGHDNDSAKRICNVVANKNDDGIKSNTAQDSDDSNKGFEQRQDDLDNPDNPANNWLKTGSEYSEMEKGQADRLDIALDIINQVRDNEASEDDDDTDITVSNLDLASEIIEQIRDEEAEEGEGDDDDDDDDDGYQYGADSIGREDQHGGPVYADTNSQQTPNSHSFEHEGPAFDDLNTDEMDTEDEPEDYNFDDLPTLDDNKHIKKQEGPHRTMERFLIGLGNFGIPTGEDEPASQEESDGDSDDGPAAASSASLSKVISDINNFFTAAQKKKQEDDTEDEVQNNPSLDASVGTSGEFSQVDVGNTPGKKLKAKDKKKSEEQDTDDDEKGAAMKKKKTEEQDTDDDEKGAAMKKKKEEDDEDDDQKGAADKKKKKEEDDTDDDTKGADLVMQNQFTDPNKLEKYLDTNAIDWDSDEEADYNEKSDTKKIDLSYYDDDIGKCVENQVLNGLSKEDATKFCNNLANYLGDGDIKGQDELSPVHYNNKEYVEGSDMPSNVKKADILDILNAYFTREKQNEVDPVAVGGDGDNPQINDLGYNHPENSIGNGDGDGVHTHSLGNDGPSYDHFGNQVYNEANTTDADEFTTKSNSSLDGNSHITEHMHPAQKQMGTQNLERVPAEEDNASMRGLGENSVGNIVRTGTPTTPLNNGIPEMTAKPETAMNGPIGAVIKDLKESISNEYKAAMEKLDSLEAAKTNQMITNCVKAKMKANDKLTEEEATKQCQKSMGGTKQASAEQQEISKSREYASEIRNIHNLPPLDESQPIKWTKSGRQSYSASACEQDLGGDEDARNICYHIAKAYDGNYDAYIADMQIKPFESNNKLFIKAFLLDSSVNLNKWGASPMTLDQNIRSYIGKPLVLRENFDHPVSNDDNLQHQLEYQELFRIGTIVDVIKKDSRYEAIAEITDDYAKKAFKEGDLPLYVSPQLYKLDSSEPDNAMTKWTGTHLAVVKDPAYTIKRATINGECTGESDKCVSYLKKAAMIRDHGYGSCGFCNYKVLTSARGGGE